MFETGVPTNDFGIPPDTLPPSLLSQKLLQHNEGILNETSAQDSGYNSSGSSVHQSPRDPMGGDMDGGGFIHRRSRASSHTSISSMPASVLTNLPDVVKPMNTRGMHDYTYQPWDDHSPSKMEAHVRSIHALGQREGTFRKPSSVRAMQMHTEDEGDDDYLTPPKRRGGQRISDVSIRSVGSSPLKRSPFYSPTGAAGKPKVKKEYPLVLLHCTLLPPSLPIPGFSGYRDQKTLREILPPVYWKRWKLLEEKIGSGVLRDRGVLISHPEDMYDLLEERLLESLELQRPRLDHGHFIGHDETESDGEDRMTKDDSGTEDEGEKCLDCGGRVVRHEMTRKWEIKVFAANGLMRAGAWAAAWKEMEKVDVEVGLWLPSDVRAELERRLMENDSSHMDNCLSVPLLQEPEDVTLSRSVRAHSPSPLLREQHVSHVTRSRERSLSLSSTVIKSPKDHEATTYSPKPSEEIALQTLLINYIRVLASDRRNVAIAILSVLVVFSALNFKPGATTSHLRPFPLDILEDAPSPSMVSLDQHPPPAWVNPTSSAIQSVTQSEMVESIITTSIPEILSSSEVWPTGSTSETRAVGTEEPSPTSSEILVAGSESASVEESEQPIENEVLAAERECVASGNPLPPADDTLTDENDSTAPDEPLPTETEQCIESDVLATETECVASGNPLPAADDTLTDGNDSTAPREPFPTETEPVVVESEPAVREQPVQPAEATERELVHCPAFSIINGDPVDDEPLREDHERHEL
ncbi:hypothetical protein P175DRAFT_0491335 [Aspergillus ochraceoroseus IBT 24754]|uniref:Flavoprotein oxygenase n=2 Tax=Aspergillus ochraceoroseus TaxID=138278 RepID=A0A2T5M322_9EURO|nr:uncharacterized protein P175DRAFT_0491335 [Aspergillus ochraceoroseus IBT 24754]KKK18644.1 hypothetical protein AOCH_006583 [Aspergillus ochraceoroseus]PTU22926.1 hypothetical protein P175DRAFT_0491335 [Aspergillus ochraceoroseus IBT 24754]